jgi:hypothetical protein
MPAAMRGSSAFDGTRNLRLRLLKEFPFGPACRAQEADQRNRLVAERGKSRITASGRKSAPYAVMRATKSGLGAVIPSRRRRLQPGYLSDFIGEFAFGAPCIVSALHAHPDVRAIAEQLAQADCDDRGHWGCIRLPGLGGQSGVKKLSIDPYAVMAL